MGLPRSGTKLLRGLLNEHGEVGILSGETEFLPHWINNWEEFGDLSNEYYFHRFYRYMKKFTHFLWMDKISVKISPKVWHERCKSFDVTGVFEALIRYELELLDGKYDVSIWGDKSPSYIRYLSLLKKSFQSAKFIHVVRDVRDYCLSINKVWGKNMFRAAQRWKNSIDKARKEAKLFPDDYCEMRYEDLLDHPEKTLRDICNFLSISFDESMVELSEPTEKVGDTRDKRFIFKNNKKKYLKKMEKDTRRKIETFSKPVLLSCGYPVDYDGPTQKLSTLQMNYYKILDGINLIKADRKEWGILHAILFHLRAASNRK
ncbi:MAG: sulfotransferase [Thermodesulfobacteriota bacterium]|nr:sulfotransferase [Thermodesulfobacteriota bacterium]